MQPPLVVRTDVSASHPDARRPAHLMSGDQAPSLRCRARLPPRGRSPESPPRPQPRAKGWPGWADSECGPMRRAIKAAQRCTKLARRLTLSPADIPLGARSTLEQVRKQGPGVHENSAPLANSFAKGRTEMLASSAKDRRL